MSRHRLSASVLAALLGFGAGPAPAEEPAGEAQRIAAVLAVERSPQAVSVTAQARGLGKAADGRYELVIVKRGGVGQSTVRQGGDLPAGGPADGTVALATSRISVGEGTSLVATLRVILASGAVYTDQYRLDATD